jgi:hypothetical protein
MRLRRLLNTIWNINSRNLHLEEEIHTTLPEEIHAWLNKEAKRADCPLNEVIEKMVVFYQKNQELPEKFISARFFLKQIIKEELAVNRTNK